ncbi:protein S40-7-like [Aristolochia californica]|uniref:protein S40-7-like n=1 Tax=Aristolochia californica TaxID=171875 RepID=UPI0035DD8359
MEAANSASPASPAVRFLGFLNQEPPEPDPDPIEFDESDFVWCGASSLSDLSSSPPQSCSSTSTSSSPGFRYPFRPDKFGLAAALSDDRRALVQRKPALDPTLSAATAARAIPPVAIPRSGSASDDLCGSLAGSGNFLQSAPVNVPVWPKHLSTKQRFVEEEDEEMEEEMLPPHEIVARSHMTTFSVFEGVGRTLKGRDLRRVRNAVWQKTGISSGLIRI